MAVPGNIEYDSETYDFPGEDAVQSGWAFEHMDDLGGGDWEFTPRTKTAASRAGVLAASRQIRNATVPILYAENLFALDSYVAIIPSLSDLTSLARQSIEI
ncbi:hypothetical protein MMC27_000902 [Xylographa pallens]|nr:hypothetical protein [Xylographa pallens]